MHAITALSAMLSALARIGAGRAPTRDCGVAAAPRENRGVRRPV